MTVILEHLTVPESGTFRIQVDQTAEIRVSAEEARKQARRWVNDYVTMQMSAEMPILTITDKIAWRVPITFHTPSAGRVGQVGTVDVDIFNGEILDATTDNKQSLLAAAQKLADKLPPYQPRTAMPQKAIIPENLPQAPKLILPND